MKNKDPKIYLKWFVYAILAFFILFFTGKIFKLFKKIFNSEDSDLIQQNLNNTLAGINIDSAQITISSLQAVEIANKMFVAMEGLTTDNDLLEEQLNKIKSAGDMILVLKTFGVRTNTDFIDEAGTLLDWFKWELTGLSSSWFPTYGTNITQLAREKCSLANLTF